MIILLSIVTEHQTSTAGLLQLLPKIHLSRKHNKHKTNIKAVTGDVYVCKYMYRARIKSRSMCLMGLPVGVLLLNEDDGVMGGVTGGVRLPLLWRGGVATLLRERLPVSESDSFG